MYLVNLNKEAKELFLELAYHLAASDGNFSESEQSLIACYCGEMKLPADFHPQTQSVNDVISKLNILCTTAEKKIIVFEAIGLALIDSDYDESERKIITLMCMLFGLEDTYSASCESILNEYLQIQTRINNLVLG